MSYGENVIVVGVDSSSSSRAAIHWAADYARASGCGLHAVHVLGWLPPSDMFAYSMHDEVFIDSAQLEDADRLLIQEVFDEADPDPDWDLRFVHGDPGRKLVELSRTARLLVVGAREHRGIGRLLSGSVGHYCLNHANCPVVSVPPDASVQPPSAGTGGTARVDEGP
jgi:nucleotide-binding universal stress UspA family protein